MKQLIAPDNQEAEQALLGAMLIDPPIIPDVLLVIPREENCRFNCSQHQQLFGVIVDMYADGKPIDLVSVRAELVRLNLLKDIGGIEYVIELSESVPSSAHADYYAKLVRDTSMLRDLMSIGRAIEARVTEYDVDPADVIEEIENRVFAISSKRIVSAPTSIAAEHRAVFAEIEARKSGVTKSDLSTGWYRLDEILGGLHRSELIVIAARPSMGKTAFAVNMAEHVASHEHTPVLFFSLEMSKGAVLQRVLSSRTGVNLHHFRNGMISDAEIEILKESCEKLKNVEFYIDDTSSLSMVDCRMKARHFARSNKVGLIVVDYLQLMRLGTKTNSRQEEIQRISGGMKDLAKTLNVPVVVLSQLNRNPESRTNNRPRMSDLRESGAIEQDADVVMLLHREEYYRGDSDSGPDVKGMAEIIVSKQRNGPTGSVKLHWEATCARFATLSAIDVSQADSYIRAGTDPLPFSRGPSAEEAGDPDGDAPF